MAVDDRQHISHTKKCWNKQISGRLLAIEPAERRLNGGLIPRPQEPHEPRNLKLLYSGPNPQSLEPPMINIDHYTCLIINTLIIQIQNSHMTSAKKLYPSF